MIDFPEIPGYPSEPEPAPAPVGPGRFDALGESYRKLRQEFYAYREVHREFAVRLYDAVTAYLQVPKGYVAYYATLGPYANKKVMGLAMAMQLADDGWWQMGLVFEVYEELGQFPTEPMPFVFYIRKPGDAFELKVADRTFHLSAGPDADFTEVAEHLYEAMRERIEGALKRFLTTGDPKHRLGF